MRRRLVLWCAAALLGFGAGTAAASYPERPITVVVAFAPGGLADTVARLVANELSTRVGQPVVVENRPGAGGVIAHEYVAGRPADGYTLMQTGPVLAAYPAFSKLWKLDIGSAYTYVGAVGETATGVFASSAFPPRSMREVVAYAKANPGVINWVQVGAGPQTLLFMAMNRQYGIQMTGIPYKGTNEAKPQLISNQVQLMVDAVGVSLPDVQAGKLRPLAVFGSRRSEKLPGVPTVSEALPDLQFTSSGVTGLLGPANLPPEVVQRLQGALREAIASPEFLKKLGALGVDPRLLSGDEFRASMLEASRSMTRGCPRSRRPTRVKAMLDTGMHHRGFTRVS